MSYCRDTFKAKRKKRFAFLVWYQPSELNHYRVYFNWTDEEYQDKVELTNRQLSQVGSCPGKFVHRERDYSGQRLVRLDHDALRDLRNQTEDYGRPMLRLPMRTRKGTY